ncbi:MAG: transglycosylase domain-containing protein [Deltaproteobacteria bacterium]|nr:transglycosylase domain-containing protein [Deltaproteobacteria bacterium]
MLLVLLALLGVGILSIVAVVWFLSRDLPTLEILATYRPPTVTVVYDARGRLLGEIYEKRRYVVPIEQIPPHVQDAFIASEDASFWTHAGVDPMGIARAVGRNVLRFKKAQGASTITQQVARNFLLSSEKRYSRKIKEMVLARRIEEAFSKEHILYLYLNQIYLGSGAYGVEAAARTYFDKHVQDLSLAEAALLAGLPQRPSETSPLRDWQAARARQEYVLGQMLDKGLIDRHTFEEALAEVVPISRRRNEFLLQAPWFTEHIRRYLVETYGFDKVYNDGLEVRSTCDLDLQKAAQESVVQRVLEADNLVGWRGAAEHLESEEAIRAHLDAQEQALRKTWSERNLRVADRTGGRGGYDPVPERSVLEEGQRYEAVVLEAQPKHLVVGIGTHRGLVPRSWTAWTYVPNPARIARYREQDDLTRAFSRGDRVQVTVEALAAGSVKALAGYEAAGPGPFVAARIYQAPALEAAFLLWRLEDGGVQAMVGGYDFEKTEFNRAVQARRQVGSTFKPIVYAAAIGTRKVSSATIIQDAPLVFNTLNDKLWKPSNYGEEYLGNITLRKALQLSRNVCTVRVLDRIGLEPVFQLAGPRLRIGYDRPTCSRTHIRETAECPGTRAPSPVKGMSWCEACDPASCPMVERTSGLTCLDEPVVSDGRVWCHSCDVNLRVCPWIRQEAMPENDPCVDARQDGEGRTVCRVCDLSVGLGSSSLTMVELTRAYTAFATGGHLVEPHWIDRVVDRDGTVIEAWQAPESWPEALEPGVASIVHWLLREVATGGTGAATNRLGFEVAGKTGTTNDFFDAWFVGYNPAVIGCSWVGYDQPKSMGLSFTGGHTALPIWMDVMKAAVPKETAPRFGPLTGVVTVPIDEATGRVATGGRAYPLLPGTAPSELGGEVGQKTAEDLLQTDF